MLEHRRNTVDRRPTMSSQRLFTTTSLFMLSIFYIITLLLLFSALPVNGLSPQSSSKPLPSHQRHRNTDNEPYLGSLRKPNLEELAKYLSSENAGSTKHHHHWSIDDWWDGIVQDDYQRSSLARARSLSDDYEYTDHGDGDPMEMAASEGNARIVSEVPFKNSHLSQDDGRSVIVDVHEHSANDNNHNNNIDKSKNITKSASIIKRRPSPGLSQNEVDKKFPKFPKGREDDIIKRNNVSFYVPHTTTAALRSHFQEYFYTVRSNLKEYEYLFNDVKSRLEKRFQYLGLPTKRQIFIPEYKNYKRHGQNLFAVLKGTNSSGKSNVIILGAHYDTVPESIGIEDNASGSVAILEIARLLKSYRCKLDSSVYFTFFDMEEDGLIGSRAFVRDYLVPVEIEAAKSNIQGAFIIDMLLQYDDTPEKQYTNILGKLLPEFLAESKANENRANFAAVWARGTVPEDVHLWNLLLKNWQNKDKYKLMSLKNPLPKYGHNLTHIIRSKEFRSFSTFLRSDHSNFWYPASAVDRTIPAVLLTDLGPWREVSASRYHTKFDNTRLLTRKNLAFLKNSIDSLVRTIIELGDGKCLNSLIQTSRQTKKLLKPLKIINATHSST